MLTRLQACNIEDVIQRCREAGISVSYSMEANHSCATAIYSITIDYRRTIEGLTEYAACLYLEGFLNGAIYQKTLRLPPIPPVNVYH